YLCNSCNLMPSDNIWQDFDNKAVGNDVISHVMSHRPFAVEIESFRMPDEAMTDHREIENWNAGGDSSIEPDEGAEDEEGTEWRSPPFKGDGGLDRLFRDVKLIRDMGYRANQSCGLHVHVDAIDF